MSAMDSKKQMARSLYLKGDQTRNKIAKKVGIDVGTLRRWATKGNWDDLKEVQQITKAELLRDNMLQLAALNKRVIEEFDGVLPKILADSKAVLLKEYENLADDPLHIYLDVCNQIIDFTEPECSLKEHQRITALLFEFIEHKAQG